MKNFKTKYYYHYYRVCDFVDINYDKNGDYTEKDFDVRRQIIENPSVFLESGGGKYRQRPIYGILSKKMNRRNKMDLGCVDLILTISYELENQPKILIVKPPIHFHTETVNGSLTWIRDSIIGNYCPCGIK
jgi:hypothetical protein